MKALSGGFAGLLALGAAAIGVPLLAVPTSPSGLGSDTVPTLYRSAVLAAAASCEGVGAPVLAAQLQQESGWDPLAVSPVGAIGLAQFMPGTWETYGVDADGDGMADPRNPIDAIWSAARYDCALRTMVAAVPGDSIELTLAAYNAGPYAVLRYRGIPPYPETQGYVRTILASLPSFRQQSVAGADGLTAAAARVRQLVIDNFGITDIGGLAKDGHAADSDHYTGRAIDVMLTPMGPANTELGWQIAYYLQSQAQALDITYLIWQGRIWSVARAAEGWRVYRHPSGGTSPTLLHLDHVHVSVG